MRLTVLVFFVLAGTVGPLTATGSDGSDFPLIAPATVDQECVRECLRESQHVSVGYEELDRRCREACEVTRAIRLLRSDDPDEYFEGVRILCASDDRRAVDPLITALMRDLEERTGLWAEIIPALGALRDSKAVQILIETLEIPDDDWLGREMSARALGEIGDPVAIPALTAAAWRGDTRDEAVMALAEIPNVGVVPVLISALDPGEDPETRDAAMKGLEWLGSMAIPALAEAFGKTWPEHPESEKRVWICRLLGLSGDPDALEVLRAHGNDPDRAVARCVAGFNLD